MLFWSAVAFAIVVIIGTSLLLVTIGYHLLFLGCPFVPTPTRIAKEMAQFVQLKGNERVYDLGAGDGAVLINVKRAYPGVQAIGFEKVITVWWWGKLRIWLSGQKVDLRRGDMFSVDLADAQVIYLYLIPHLMGKLEPKLDAELKPGTIVISHAFSFPNRKPLEEKRMPSGALLLRYVW